MRSLLVYTIVILAGAISFSFASRAERWVATGGQPATAESTRRGEISAVRLELYAPGQATPIRVIRVGATQIDVGDGLQTAMGPDEWHAVQGAVAGLPAQLPTERAPATPTQGGDLLVIERGGTAARYVLTNGWEASPVDAVKEAVWQAIRARWKPARKRRPSTEFVEPFQTLRTQLRIRF